MSVVAEVSKVCLIIPRSSESCCGGKRADNNEVGKFEAIDFLSVHNAINAPFLISLPGASL
jgi:hypothetical protein